MFIGKEQRANSTLIKWELASREQDKIDLQDIYFPA